MTEESTSRGRGGNRPMSRGVQQKDSYGSEIALKTFKAIQYVTEAALSHLKPDDLLKELLARIREVLRGDTAAILLLSLDRQELIARASSGLEEEVGEAVCLPVGHGIAGRIASSRQPVIVADLSRVEVANPIMRGRIRSLIGAPLLLDDRVIGVVHVGTIRRRRFTNKDLSLLQLVADRAAVVIERASAEAARSELAAIVNSSQDAIIGIALDGTIASWNPGAERLYEYTVEEAIGKPFSMVLLPERSGELTTVLNKLKLGESIKSYDAVRVRKDGTQIDISATISAIKDASGEIVGASTIARDITERKQAENERIHLLARERAARAEAEVERARFQAILEGAPNGILFCDAESETVTANPKAMGLLGWAPSTQYTIVQLVGRVRRPDGRPLSVQELPSSRALQGHAVSGEELLLMRADGIQTPVLVGAAPVRDLAERVTGAVVLYQDISTVKEAERMREEWTSIITHDMRQPLTIILGYAATLRGFIERRASSEFERRAVEHIVIAASNLNRIIADLLDASRLETQRLKLERRDVDLAALTREVVERAEAITSGHRVRVVVDGTIPPVAADPARVEQVLGNLFSNAVKYGYLNTEILVHLRSEGGMAKVSVTNEGEGIPPEEDARLFTRFHRTKSAEEGPVKGLGLGLYVSRGLVEAHGGHIWVESIPNRTTTFHFTLPLSG